MRIEAIVVATDFSENAEVALETAADLAAQLHAKLLILHVQDESALRIAIREGLLDGAQTDEDLRKAVEALTRTRLEKLLEQIDRSKVDANWVSRRGEAGRQIVEYAREVNAGMVAIGRHGAGGVMSLLSVVVGSVTEWVIKHSPCPVLVVRSEHHR